MGPSTFAEVSFSYCVGEQTPCSERTYLVLMASKIVLDVRTTRFCRTQTAPVVCAPRLLTE